MNHGLATYCCPNCRPLVALEGTPTEPGRLDRMQMKCPKCGYWIVISQDGAILISHMPRSEE
jgi:hypothetical protein